MEQVKEWVENWFIKNGKIGRDELINTYKESYIEQGLIDSFGFIQLVNNIEEQFHIELDDKDFEDEGFFTISGLIDIIEKKDKI